MYIKVFDIKDKSFLLEDVYNFKFKIRNAINEGENKLFCPHEGKIIICNFNISPTTEIMKYLLKHSFEECLFIIKNVKKIYQHFFFSDDVFNLKQLLLLSEEPKKFNYETNRIEEIDNEYLKSISCKFKSYVTLDVLKLFNKHKKIKEYFSEKNKYVLRTEENIFSNLDKKIENTFLENISYDEYKKLYFLEAKGNKIQYVSKTNNNLIDFLENSEEIKDKKKFCKALAELPVRNFYQLNSGIYFKDNYLTQKFQIGILDLLYFENEDNFSTVKKELEGCVTKIKNIKDISEDYIEYFIQNNFLNNNFLKLKNGLCVFEEYSKEKDLYIVYYNRALYILNAKENDYFMDMEVNEEELQRQHKINLLKINL